MDELEYGYRVVTRTEGTVLPDQGIINQMNAMGSATYSHADEGKVKVIVEMEQNRITKNKIVWVDGTTQAFQQTNQAGADQLLQDSEALVRANGDGNGNGELKVVIVGKK